MNLKTILRPVIGLILAVFFVWLIARQINLAEVQRAFAGTTISWVVIGLLLFMTGYACRIERWRLMLQRDNPQLTWARCAGPLLGSFATNNVLPFRAGDALRAFAFNQRLGLSSGIIIATLFAERLLDLLMVLLMLGSVLAIFHLDIAAFTGAGSSVLILLALGILTLLLKPRLFAPLAILAGKFIARVSPKLGTKIFEEIRRSLATLEHLSQGVTMLKLVGWSIAAWLAEGGVFFSAAQALSSITNPAAGWLALPVGTLATLIPSTPGYVGTFDYFTVRAMTSMGNETSAATAYALLVHIMLWLPPTAVGGLYLMFSNTKKPSAEVRLS